MFFGDYRFYGEHAQLADELVELKSGGIFDTLYDLYFTALVIGYIDGMSTDMTNDRSKNKTIFSDKLDREYEKTELIVKTLLLSDPNISEDTEEEDNKINRALKHFKDDSVKRKNIKYIENYTMRGIEVIYKYFKDGKKHGFDKMLIFKNLLEDYGSEKADYEGIHNLIIENSKV